MEALLLAVGAAVAVLALAAAMMCAAGPAAGSAVLYVSPEGNDAWSGRLAAPNAAKSDGPLATPVAARDAVRKLRAAGRLKGGATIQLRSGTYYLSEPLILTPQDSGTAAAPLVLEAYPGEKPVLSGGRRIAGFIKDAAGRWTAAIPEVRDGAWSFRQLFVGGEGRTQARLPKEGFFKVVSQPGVDWQTSKYNTPGDTFEYAPGDIKASWAGQDVEIVLLHFWVDAHLRLAGVNDERRVAVCDRKARYRFTDDHTQRGARYYVVNAPEALATPGHWHLDRARGMLRYLPKPGEDPAKAEVIAPRLTQCVRFEGAPDMGKFIEYVTLRGLTISHTEWELPSGSAGDEQAAQNVPGAISATGLRHAAIEGCRIENIGTYGIDLGDGCREVCVAGNEIAHTGAGGIKVNGSTPTGLESRRTCRNVIADNHIHDGGEIWHSGLGILICHSGENLVAHNHIHHLYYTGISIGWTWGYAETVSKGNIIEYNHIHDIGLGLLSDMGGIYTLGQSQGTIIRCNLIHDILSHGYGGWGIYTDEGSTGILIENNVVYRTKTGGFHQHYGRENTVCNNVFAFSKAGQIQRTRMEPHLSFTFEHNIVYWNEGPLLHGKWKDDKYKFDYNVYWDASGKPVNFADKTFSDWQKTGQDAHSAVADPHFMDPEKGNFALRPGSPALKLGFKPVDLKGVGIRAK